MISPIQIYRLLQIFIVISKQAFNRRVIGKQSRFLRLLTYTNPFSFQKKHESRGESIRIAFESLGPIYVKFGQLLSTRSDIIPPDILLELEKLQDRVPPFDSNLAIKIIETDFQKPLSEIYAQFDPTPLASASISQVHAAKLNTGEDVIVKILRPNIIKTIKRDISVLRLAAKLAEKFWRHGKRLRPIALVREFEKTTLDELDLTREAANASQLRRNFERSEMIYVPKIYWDYTYDRIMTQERIYGVRISDIDTLRAAGTDMKKLAEYGVEIFFTQVFRDAFFHADMHPGNLFVDITDPGHPKYLGIDFGIMGTLSPTDQSYLAENILAFLQQDYRRVALLHIESEWVNPNTRVDEFESAIRTVCEPIFQKPLSEISFGQLLLRLFQTAERFEMHVQPQLMLLQKTLFYIESLGRKLYPQLDLWTTAKPFMSKWMREQRGLKSLAALVKDDWHMIAEKIIKTPALYYNVLNDIQLWQQQKRTLALTAKKPAGRLTAFTLGIVVTAAIALILHFIFHGF